MAAHKYAELKEEHMTIKEVAKLAGVSSAAVSRYFNGGSLSKEKSDRIRRVVEVTDYKPNPAAHLMRTGKSGQVGVIVPHIHSDSLSRIMTELVKIMEEEGYVCIVSYSGGDRDKEIHLIDMMQKQQMEGIILMGTGNYKELKEAIKICEIPIVVTGQNIPGIASVYHDDKNALRELTGEMLKTRKKVAFIGVTNRDPAAGKARRQGVEMAFEDAGLDKESLILVESDFSLEGGYQAMKKLMKEHPDVDGVICATDMIAHGALQAIHDEGKHVPEEIGIAGVGNHWSDTISNPPLTSVSFKYRECGVEAGQLLLKMIREEGRKAEHIQLDYSIVERGSL
ncbi:MAG: LacI family DNA-binding transcriptional regulator [Eubacterium sp.]|nr:LacI family DNA-binding transcriptional regulator [Eubacterium sp.]